MNIFFNFFKKTILSTRKKIYFEKKYISITEGQSKRINFVSKRKLNWNSDNENIAQVNEIGIITACSFCKWKPDNLYKLHQVIIHDDKLYECISSGKSDNSEPVWIHGYNKVKLGNKVYNCIRKHTSSLDNKPGIGADWKDYWEIYPYNHAWTRDWRQNLSFSMEPIIKDGDNVRWVHRFKTAIITATTEDGKYSDICHISVVPWIVGRSNFEIISSNSQLANIAQTNKNWDLFYTSNTSNQIKILLRKIYKRLFVRSHLRLLSIENQEGQNIFFAAGSGKIANCNLYKISGDINAIPQIIYKFTTQPEKMLITPFGYFIMVDQTKNRLDAKTIYRSEKLSTWNLEYTFNRRNNYVLWQGWDFEYNENTKTGILYIAEKHNPIPTKSAIITKIIYKYYEKGSFVRVNEDGNHITEGSKNCRTAYEIPVVSDRVLVNDANISITYSCIKTHVSDESNKPGIGDSWQEFWKSTENTSDNKWSEEKLYLSTEDRGQVRHLHNLQKDPFSQNIWLSTGDEDSESNIFYHNNKFLPDKKTKIVILNLIGSDSQEWRTCGFVFTKKFIYWGMDAQVDPQHIFRIRRSDNENYISKSKAYYPKEDLGSLSDKSFFSSLGISDKGDDIALLSTGYEISQYNIDNLARIFAVKEKKDGTVEIQEVLCAPAGSFGRFIPVFQDPDGYVYFALRNLNIFPQDQFIKTKLHWEDVDLDFKK